MKTFLGLQQDSYKDRKKEKKQKSLVRIQAVGETYLQVIDSALLYIDSENAGVAY